MPYMSKYTGDYRLGYYQGDFFGLGAIAGIAKAAISRVAKPRMPQVPAGLPVTPVPGIGGRIQRILPGGRTGYQATLPAVPRGAPAAPGISGLPGYGGGRKRRRINYANPKALKRALRREKGFIDLARRTLRGSGYTIKRTGLGGRRRKS